MRLEGGFHDGIDEFSAVFRFAVFNLHEALVFIECMLDAVDNDFGLTEGHRLRKEAAPLLRARTFADLPLPFRAVATDLQTGEEIVLADGPLLPAIALAPDLPVLAVDVTQGIPDSGESFSKAPSLGDVLTRTIRIAESRLAAYRRAEDPPDVLVEVPVASIPTLDFLRAPEASAISYRATLSALSAAGW